MDSKNDIKNYFYDSVNIFKIRSKQNNIIIDNMVNKMEGKDIKSRFFELLPSYIHMYLNRLYISQQRKYELVIYHFLDKYYTSKIIIEKNT